MDLQALGYVGVRRQELDDWTAYGTRLLGMQMVDRTRRRWRCAWTTASSA